MAVRRNGGYTTDPALATSFDNLAAAFATPSGSDVLGYTKSTAEREKAARLADLYNYAKSPGYDQTLADRMGIAAGNYNPSQSYYAVDEGNDTTLKTNAATNAASLAVADKNNAGALARQFALPIQTAQGATTTLPAQTQAATGLPGTISGAFVTAPGDTVTRDGVTLAQGTPKPLTDSEVKGAILGRQSPEDQRAVAMQGVGVTPVLDAKGEPTIVMTPDAAGRTPYNVDTRQPQIANYKTPDGKIGTASLDKDSGKWKDTQTGAELPAGIQTYTANLQGTKDDTGLGANAKNSIDGMLLDMSLVENTAKQLRGVLNTSPAVQGLVGSIRGTVQNVVQTGNEVGQLLNVNMDKMKKDIVDGRVDPKVAEKFSNFDPNIPAVHMLQTLLTAQVAKMMDPNGRISNDRYEQVSKAFGAGGLTGNTKETLATLDRLDKIIADRRNILSPVRPEAAKIGQTTAPAAAATPAVRTWNPATGALE